LSAVLLVGVVWAPALRDAFFIYDDFAHFGLCAQFGLGDFFRKTMVSTFRPIGFAAFSAQFRLLGWEHPSGYVAVGAVLYLINAVLTGRVARAYGESALASSLAATFFLVFPATIELRVWPAGQFDLLCAMFVLVSLLAWAGALRPDAVRGRRVVLAICASLAFSMALLAKENAIGMPVLLAVLATGRRDRGRHARPAAVASALGASALVVAAFLVARSRVMPLTSTHYGDVGTLFRNAPLLDNLGSFARGFVTPPYFEDPSPLATLVRVSGYLGLAGIVLGVRAAGLAPGFGLLLASGTFLAPVLWVPYVAGTASGGRHLHLSSLPLAILFGIGAAALFGPASGPPRARVAGLARKGGVLLVVGFVLGSVASGGSAARAWRDAAGLSHSVMNQVERYADAPALFVRNVPWGLREGPPVLSCYAFRVYLGRHGTHVPPIRCDGVIVERGWRAVLEWTPRRPDPYSDYANSREDEIAVEVDLQKRARGGS
jgi:hypothetical protein